MGLPHLIIITGPPASGKTTLATRLATDLRLPLFSKDAIKESLFESLGVNDRAWSMKLGVASIELLFRTLAWQLQAGHSVIAETAFIPAYDTARFMALQQDHPCIMLQLYVTAQPDVLCARFAQRAASGARHPGHVDHQLQMDDFAAILRSGKYAPLAIPAQLLRIDTTRFAERDYPPLLATIKHGMNQPAS